MSQSVAVVIPMPLRAELTPDEEVSLKHVVHFLGSYDRYFVAADGVRCEREGFRVERFPRRFFGSAEAHGRMQLAEEFYERFRRYTFILMYHLDALVFSDQLQEWCSTDFDFVGPPWLPCDDSPWVTHARVGNSGFALMRVESFLQVMRSTRPAVDPAEYWRQLSENLPRHRQWLNLPRKYLKRVRAFNNVTWEMRRWPSRMASDYFWSDQAVNYWPPFRVAPVDVGLRFAFEVAPRMCFEMNTRRLPFGCHAWARYDRAFWEPYLLS